MTGSLSDRFHAETDRAATGGPEKYHEVLKARGKMFVRDRVDLLCDPGSFVEDGLLANAMTEGHGADAVVTGRGTIEGRPIMVIANDPTVKAGSWGRLTVEKIIRALEALSKTSRAASTMDSFSWKLMCASLVARWLVTR